MSRKVHAYCNDCGALLGEAILGEREALYVSECGECGHNMIKFVEESCNNCGVADENGECTLCEQECYGPTDKPLSLWRPKETTKVYCEDCKHMREPVICPGMFTTVWCCDKHPNIDSRHRSMFRDPKPITYSECSLINRNNDCKDYEAK